MWRRHSAAWLPPPLFSPLAEEGVLATAAVVVGPFGAFVSTMGAEDAMVTRDPNFVWSTLIMHNMTDVLALLMPGTTSLKPANLIL